MVDVVATRQRIIEATYARIARDGLAQTTVEAVAQEAGVSRATIYRHFPRGRDELVQAVVSWEVGEFFDAWRQDAAEAADFADWLARGLVAARRRLDEHRVLQHALELEAEQLLPRLVTVMPIVVGMLRDELATRLADEQLQPGVDRGEAAEYLARLIL
ncbi:MAG TPA: helix-turn-helix domain-containing protein, partial [Acidimicrobiales bacterium]